MTYPKKRNDMKSNITALTVKNLLTVLVALTLTITASAQTRAAKVVNGDGLLIDAVQEYENGNWKKASTILDEIIKTVPENDAAYYYRGLCSMRLNNATGAEKDLKHAVALDSTNYWYRYMLAGLYGMTGRTVLTTDMYESLLKDFPKKGDLYYSLANLYINQQQYDKALSTIRDIETQFGKSDGTVMTKFNILRQQNKNEEAFKELEEYNKEYSSPQVLSILGDYEMGMYNDSTALAYYNEALSIDKSCSPALLGKAEAYRIIRKYPQYFEALDELMADRSAPSEGKANYLQAIIRQTDPRFIKSFQHQFDSTMTVAMDAHPSDSLIMETAGLYYFLTDRKPEAAGMFRQITKLNPDSKGAMASYIQILAYMQDWKQVVAVSDSALTKFPDEIGFIDYANAGEFNLKNYKGVIANCEKMLRIAPRDSAVAVTAWSMMGDVYHLMNDTPKAYKAYDNVLKIAPGYAPVLNNYAYYLSEEGKKLKKAYAMSKKTVEAEPDNATYLDTFGWILYLQGKALEAKPFFKHAMLYGGKDSATILNHYAAVLEALGENDLAKVYRQQAKNKAAEGQE
mgnify:FL=1